MPVIADAKQTTVTATCSDAPRNPIPSSQRPNDTTSVPNNHDKTMSSATAMRGARRRNNTLAPKPAAKIISTAPDAGMSGFISAKGTAR